VGILHQYYQLHIDHGHDAVLLDTEAVRDQLNSPLYFAGVWSKKNSGIVHPALLAWGLKRAALSLGVRLHEFSPMTKIEDSGSAMNIKTHDGEVRTPRVLLATNAFAHGHRKIKSRVAAIRDRIVATQPLTDEQLSRIGWSNRQGVYDTRTQLNYTRLTRDNRIIFGGRLGYFYNGDTDPDTDRDSQVYERLAGSFFNTFPQLDDVSLSHAWSGPIALTTRMAVHFQRYYGNKVVYAGGYSGFGVSTSRFGARIGLDILDGRSSPELELECAKTMPNWMPPEPFRWIGAQITMYALDTADEKGGWRIPWLAFVRKLGFPIS
jgi:glycine/D-amino acid oxidase-like deaminating enzyme